jgi:hypothetical protein
MPWPGEDMSLKDIAYTKISLAELEALRAEIERLRIEWAEVCNDYGRACAEIKRLRAALEEIKQITSIEMLATYMERAPFRST